MTEIEVIGKLLPWIKDLGLPVIALYYLFKAYMSRVDKTDRLIEEYGKVVKEHAANYSQLTAQIRELTNTIRDEGKSRQDFLEKLIDQKFIETGIRPKRGQAS